MLSGKRQFFSSTKLCIGCMKLKLTNDRVVQALELMKTTTTTTMTAKTIVRYTQILNNFILCLHTWAQSERNPRQKQEELKLVYIILLFQFITKLIRIPLHLNFVVVLTCNTFHLPSIIQFLIFFVSAWILVGSNLAHS